MEEDDEIDEDLEEEGPTEHVNVYVSDEEIIPELFVPDVKNDKEAGNNNVDREDAARGDQPRRTRNGKQMRGRKKKGKQAASKAGLEEPEFLEEVDLDPQSSDDDDPRPRPTTYIPNVDIDKYVMKEYEDFGSAEVFREIVRDIAIRDGRGVKFEKNENGRITVKCLHEGCPYRLHASSVPDTGRFMLKKANFQHTCASDYKAVPVTSRWILKKFVDRLRSNPKYPVAAMMEDIAKEHHIDISVYQAYKVRRDALKMIHGDYKVQYGQLWDYCNALLMANGGCDCVKLKFEVDNVSDDRACFQRIFISFDAVRKGFLSGCRPVVGLDGTFLKGTYGGILLTATCSDGNNNCMVLAYAVVENECYKTWRWFMDHFLDYFGENFCFLSDRQKGLQRIFQNDLEGVDWRICCRHLYANFRDKGFGGAVLKQLMWNAARAYCRSDFNYYMGEIAKVNGDAWNYLNAISPRQWSRHAFKVSTRSDALTNNSAESFNKDILDLRSKPIITMLEGIRSMIMVKFQKKREGAAHHVHEFTPLAMGRLSESVKGSKFCKALYSGSGIYQVEDRDKRWVVNIIKQQCGCGFWELVGIPCRHAVSAIQKSGEQPEKYISDYYSLEKYRKIYEGLIMPIPSSDQWDKTCLSPLKHPIVKAKTGRPAMKRRRSRGEELEKPRTRVKSHRCSNCKEQGHKYVNCPKPLTEELQLRKSTSRGGNGKNDAENENVDNGNNDDQQAGVQGETGRDGEPVAAMPAQTAGLQHERAEVEEPQAITKTKAKRMHKLTPYRPKRVKVSTRSTTESTQNDGNSQTENGPKWVNDNTGMGIVYDAPTEVDRSQEAKKRGRPRKEKINEGLEPPAKINNAKLKGNSEIQKPIGQVTTRAQKANEDLQLLSEVGNDKVLVKEVKNTNVKVTTRAQKVKEALHQPTEVGKEKQMEDVQQKQKALVQPRGKQLLTQGKGLRSSRRPRSHNNPGPSRLSSTHPNTNTQTQLVQPRFMLSQPQATNTSTRRGDQFLTGEQVRMVDSWVKTLVGFTTKK